MSAIITPWYAAQQFNARAPRFADDHDIDALKLLRLRAIADRCRDFTGFCTCEGGCWDRNHWGRRVTSRALDFMTRAQLEEVVERLIYLGEIERKELAECGSGRSRHVFGFGRFRE